MNKLVKNYKGTGQYNKKYEFNEWLKQANVPPMTNTQHQFAQMLFEKDMFDLLQKFGDLDIVYNSIRKHLKP